MIDELETQLRDALHARAGEVPTAATERVRHRDYSPRTVSLRPPAAVGGVLAAAAAGVAIVGLGTSTPAAFAGWTASPTPAQDGQVTTAEASCRQHLAAVPAPPGANPVPSAPTSPVLADTRGPFSFVIFAGTNAVDSCITSSSFTAVSTSYSSAPITTPAGQVDVQRALATAADGKAYSFAEGRAGAGVTAVTLVLADGTQVQATVDNGWFVAWWPGSSAARSAQVATAQGTSTQALPDRGCPAPPAAARSTCGSSAGAGAGAGSSAGGGGVQTSGMTIGS